LSPSLISSLIILCVLIWLSSKFHRRYKQKKLAQTPLPTDWIVILQNKVSLYSILPDALRNQLHSHIQIFLDEKEFMGQGIEITDEIKLTIAGNACILLLHSSNKVKPNKIQKTRSFPDFTSIIVYPDTYVAKQTNQNGLVEHQEYSAAA